ncbi:MAG: NTP transferase domain-containing protein [Acidobacteria bacterium]|nr:NTP transferase domain-containing protein [Acidobacteriota bacterium]
MKAVILAAGEGRRIKPHIGNAPKPLTKLLGLTLIERAILSAREAGVTEFLVVVGYKKKIMTSYLRKLERRYRLTIRVVENNDWTLGNGSSALAVSPYLKEDEPFLLLMSDHIVAPDILKKLIAQGKRLRNGCLLAVDLNWDKEKDTEEATKVRIEGERLVAIGKELSSFDGLDTGAFFCFPTLFPALRASAKEGDYTLTGGIRKLVERGNMFFIPTEGLFWQDVDTKEDLKKAKRILLSHISSKDEDGFVSQYLNRRLSRFLSSYLADWGILPNLITVTSFLLCIIGGFLFAKSSYSYIFLAGILIQFASVLDGCDGEVARLTFKCSPFGGWFDTVTDRYADIVIALGITYSAWQAASGSVPWILGTIAGIGFIMPSYAKKEFALRYHKPQPNRGLIAKLIKRDLRLFVLFVGSVLNRQFEALLFAGALSHIGVMGLFISARKD